jgi:hypothetical protein
MKLHISSMAIDFKSLFSIGPTVREAGHHHRGDHGIDLNSNCHADQSTRASTRRDPKTGRD